MKWHAPVGLGLFLITGIAPVATATHQINSAVVHPRVLNYCPGSHLTTAVNYPASLVIDDTRAQPCPGIANMHVWRFSEDNAVPASFNNRDAFRSCADLVVTGDGEAAFGLQISPWWAPDLEGRFELNDTTGFADAYGGRLPPYSFALHGVNIGYVRNTPIHFEMTYRPHGLSRWNPATVEYRITYNNMDYTSGPLPFDQGTEGASYGEWGIQNDARVGGHVYFDTGQSGNRVRVEWRNICFEDLTVDVAPSTWSLVKQLFRDAAR